LANEIHHNESRHHANDEQDHASNSENSVHFHPQGIFGRHNASHKYHQPLAEADVEARRHSTDVAQLNVEHNVEFHVGIMEERFQEIALEELILQ
jgi:hypothetical protein